MIAFQLSKGGLITEDDKLAWIRELRDDQVDYLAEAIVLSPGDYQDRVVKAVMERKHNQGELV